MKGHGAAAVLFAALAIVWTFPLVTNLSGLVPGVGPGDTLQFLWNFWWMRTALASGLDVFHTNFMFAPVGSSLVLHTLTPLPAFVAAELLSPLSVAAGMNVTILASLSLNGFCAYLLALRLGADRAGAIIGGLIFGGSSYVFSHLHGHFNLTTAWTIPLFALLAIRAMRGGVIWAMVAGLVLGATAYIDYYYLVYESALAVLIAATTSFEWSIASPGPRSPLRVRASRVVLVLLAVVGVLAAVIVATGGFSIAFGPRTISARQSLQSVADLLVAGGALALAEIPGANSVEANRTTFGRTEGSCNHAGDDARRGSAGGAKRRQPDRERRLCDAEVLLAERTERHRSRNVAHGPAVPRAAW